MCISDALAARESSPQRYACPGDALVPTSRPVAELGELTEQAKLLQLLFWSLSLPFHFHDNHHYQALHTASSPLTLTLILSVGIIIYKMR